MVLGHCGVGGLEIDGMILGLMFSLYKGRCGKE